jgi:adenosylcobinamide-GDP ribazoletransferase
VGPLRVALGLFTVIPAGATGRVGRPEAARAICWLPVAGLVVALPAAGVLLAVDAGGHGTARRLLAAVLAAGVVALLTGGLHLDGLADTADGLGSRRPAEQALAVMRRSDIGPFGVVALLLVLLIQVTAVAALPPGGVDAAALVAAAVTGRVAALLATGPSSPAARPDGFGALVTAATSVRTRAGAVAGLLVAVAAGAALLGGEPLAWRAVAAAVAGLLGADLLRRAARRVLGGMTGDVFGALIELGATTTLLALALLT